MKAALRALAIGTAALIAAPAMAQRLFVDDGAVPYTADQLARGQAAYARVCVACHGADLEGSQFGPTLKGEPFAGHWRGRTRAAFSEQVRSTMPPRGMGSLSGQAYSDIEALILQNNGIAAAGAPAPAGSTVVVAEAARSVAEAPDSRPRAPLRNLDDPRYKAVVAARSARL